MDFPQAYAVYSYLAQEFFSTWCVSKSGNSSLQGTGRPSLCDTLDDFSKSLLYEAAVTEALVAVASYSPEL